MSEEEQTQTKHWVELVGSGSFTLELPDRETNVTKTLDSERHIQNFLDPEGEGVNLDVTGDLSISYWNEEVSA